MTTGLNVNDVVRTTISLSAVPAGFRNFGACMVLGPSNVIDVTERRRRYADIGGVASDFGTTTPEYAFAALFFAQDPQPDLFYIGRWAQTATPGILHGAGLTPAQRLLTAFTGVASGGLRILVDGTLRTLAGLNFTAQTNLNGVASVVQAALVAAGAAGATVAWDAEDFRFTVQSGTVGPASSVGYATAPATGTDVSVLLGLSIAPTSSGANADAPVPGVAPERLADCVSIFDTAYGDWYALSIASSTPPSDADHVAAAGYIEAAGRPRVYGIGSQNTTLADDTRTDDLASVLNSAGYGRTMVAYSTSTPFAIASLFGRFATVDYSGSNTTITLKFKQMPGVAPEYLTETQAAALDAKGVNYFAAYQNGASIVQQGVMSSGIFIDSRINADWLANYAQTNLFNLLVRLPKLPQTDQGVALMKADLTASLEQGVTNGYLAPGVWNAAGFGTLRTGDFLPLGFLVYAPLVASQNETDRAARKSVPFQIAAKEAGAVHSASVSIVVNP